MIPLNDETKKSYNRTAKKYFENILGFEKLPELDEFCQLVLPEGKILDLGCGPGHHSAYFYDKGFDVIGIDFSDEMITLAKSLAKDVEFQVMNIKKLDFNKNSFNGIWASASLIHIEKDKIQIVLDNIYSLLRSNGIFYLSLKEGTGEENTIDNRYGGVIKFHSYYGIDEIESYLKSSGFEIIKSYIVGQRANYDTKPWIHVFAKKLLKT